MNECAFYHPFFFSFFFLTREDDFNVLQRDSRLWQQYLVDFRDTDEQQSLNFLEKNQKK